MINERQLELEQETIRSKSEFDELLSLAIETTLSNPQIFQTYLEQTNTREQSEEVVVSLFQQMGLLAAKDFFSDEKKIKPPEAKEELYLPYDPEIHKKIEALGQALLEEAFECLGTDASEKIKEIQAAKTLQEKIRIIDWLIGRLNSISEASTEKAVPINEEDAEQALQDDAVVVEVERSEEDKFFYHPARLSPKLIGRFPNINVEPTCLGYSILIASFFEKAGIPHIHAGVASTASFHARQSQMEAASYIYDHTESIDIRLPDHIDEYLEYIRRFNLERMDNNAGFHAAVLARFSKDEWVQLDFNYNSNIVICSPASNTIEENYQELLAMNSVAPGLESLLINDRSLVPFRYALAIKKLGDKALSIEETDSFLQNISEETGLAEILEHYFMDFFDFDSTVVLPDLKIALEDYCHAQDFDKIRYIQSHIHKTLTQYVFSDALDGDISQSLARCKYDSAYRTRRAEDLALAPIYAVFKMLMTHGNTIIKSELKYPHAVLNTGVPAYRIGVSVLSDFASYCGDNLPLSFWLTYWPSTVSLIEHHQNSGTAAQKELKTQFINQAEEFDLLYNELNGIVRDVQEQGGDSLEQGGAGSPH